MATKTPLYDEHLALGGKMTEFAGWEMPLWYSTGQTEEHHTTRKTCGLFDISHMGEYEIRGTGAQAFLSRILTNRVDQMEDGQAMYHFMLNESGGVVDDCILCRFSGIRFMLVVNAGNIDTDFQWLSRHATDDIELEDISNRIVKIDLQGPAAPRMLAGLMSRPEQLSHLKFFRFIDQVRISGMPVLVSRTGYTGEIGFELFTDSTYGVDLWRCLLNAGRAYGMLPCGLGARDTLRTEAGLPLYGHELKADRVAAGHPWPFVMDMKKDFIGKKALDRQVEKGVDYFVVPFKLDGKRKAMPGWTVLYDDGQIGSVLSGVISPTLGNQPIGFAGLSLDPGEDAVLKFKRPGREDVLEGRIVSIPFVPLTSRKAMNLFL